MASNKKSKVVLQRQLRYKFHRRIRTRLILDTIFLILLICGLFYTFNRSFSITKSKVITYKEVSNVDYKVYLKDNNFYESSYLDKDMAYVASLIDKIKIKYNYNFVATENSDLDINYKVIAKLVIASQNNSKIFFEKDYNLTKDIIDEMVNKKEYIIDRDVIIDYQYYNNLANEFKSNYAVNTTSRLDVYLEINEKNKDSNSYEFNNKNNVILSIPLSEQEISISLDNTNINNSKNIKLDKKFVVNDISFIVFSVIIFILMLYVLVSLLKMIYLITKKNLSAYDKFVRRLLMGYDRIIINVKSVPDLSDYNLIEVENFQELVDVRDNTKEPINYHVIKEHAKCEFFVINDNNLYRYEVDAQSFNKDESNG
ncbi:MAG: hypothetical protein IKH54_06440 [Bacilli bacterium]|nr:hypothetical protein [Bacilli bacterium]